MLNLSSMLKLLTKFLIVVLALLLAAYVVPGVAVDGLYTALIAAAILGLVNLVVRPLLIILTLPITILTLGFFIIVVNAFLFWFVASFIDGFSVDGFLSALLGTLVVSVFSWAGNALLKHE